MSTVIANQISLLAWLVFHVNCHCKPECCSHGWFLFHSFVNVKRQNLHFNCHCKTDFVIRLVGEAIPHQPQKQFLSLVRFRCFNMKLTRELFHINQTLLLSTKLSWCPIKTNQTRLSSTSEFGLSCLLSTNFTVIFDCLVCLVCWQPISPSYLVAWFVLFVINQCHLIIAIQTNTSMLTLMYWSVWR